MVDLGIIIVSWNVRDLLVGCLESLLGPSAALGCGRPAVSGEIVVVDNASTDGSPEMVRSRFPSIRLIVSEKNLGFASGVNLGLRALGLDAQCSAFDAPRYALLLNPDTVVRGGALEAMLRFMDATPQAGVCGARLIYGDGSFQHSAFAFPGLWQIVLDSPDVPPRLQDLWLNGRYPRRLYFSGQPFEIDHPLGAAMMVRTETVRHVGLMDEDFYMYCEEIDWCWRIKTAGWKIYCVPQAEIVHYGGQSTRQVEPEMLAALWTSRLRLYQKHYPAWKLAAAQWLVRRKMRAEMRRANMSLARGDIDKVTHARLLEAYRHVIALYSVRHQP